MKVKAIVEIPKYSTYKYEFNENMQLTLDRVINQPIPFNYGFIPNTLCGDGDPIDIFIVSNDPIEPGTMVDVELIGAFECLDQGENDDKLIGILEGDKEQLDYISDINRYLETYKSGFEVKEFVSAEDAEDLLLLSKTF